MNRLLLSLTIAGALFSGVAAEFTANPALHQPGERPPVQNASGRWQFTAPVQELASAVQMRQSIDFSQAGYVEIEFEAGVQSNPFPRIFETGCISIHGQANAQGLMTAVKVLVQPGGNAKPVQIIHPLKGGGRHVVAMGLDVSAGKLTFALDGQRKETALSIAPERLKALKPVLGAISLKDRARGFTGIIDRIEVLEGTCNPVRDPALAGNVPGAKAPIAPATGEDIDLSRLSDGKFLPEYREGALHFKATPGAVTCVALPKEYDLGQGIRVELEFRLDGIQNNSFPRLVEGRDVSIHLECTDTKKNTCRVKILASNPKNGAHAQVILPVPGNPQEWHRLVATMEPQGHRLTLQVDDAPPVKEIMAIPDFKPGITKLLLGARNTRGTDNRGFSGAIRNLRITTPYDPNAGAGMEKISHPVINGRKVEFSIIKHMKGRHLAFPGAAILPDGRWAVVFREGEGHVCPYGRICVIYSWDQGKNWSAPVAIADTPSDERDPSIHTLPDGRLLVTHGGWNSWMAAENTRKEFPGESAYILADKIVYGGSVYMFSADGGKSWKSQRNIPAFAPHGPAVTKDRLYAVSKNEKGDTRTVEMWIMDLKSGAWEGPYVIAKHKLDGSISFEEPHATVLQDGSIVVAIREPRQGYLHISRSTDGGKSWSPVERTPIRGFPHHLLQLKDGRLLCTYGYRYYPYGIRGCFSTDGGKSWDLKNEVVIQNNGLHTDLGYPVSLQLADGSIWTVYYHNNREIKECFIEGARWMP